MYIIALDNGGSKEPIQLSGRGASCLAEMLNLQCLRIFMPIQQSVFNNNLYLETWSWLPVICAEIASSQVSGYKELHKTCYFLCFLFIYLSV